MIKTAAGPDGVWIAGRVYTISDALAKQYIEAGAAISLEPEKIEEPTKIEATSMEPEETEMMPRPAKRGKKR